MRLTRFGVKGWETRYNWHQTEMEQREPCHVARSPGDKGDGEREIRITTIHPQRENNSSSSSQGATFHGSSTLWDGVPKGDIYMISTIGEGRCVPQEQLTQLLVKLRDFDNDVEGVDPNIRKFWGRHLRVIPSIDRSPPPPSPPPYCT